MADQQTVVEGKRTIARHPEAAEDRQWWGSIDSKAYPERYWRGQWPEQVEKQMTEALGKIPTSEYEVLE